MERYPIVFGAIIAEESRTARPFAVAVRPVGAKFISLGQSEAAKPPSAAPSTVAEISPERAQQEPPGRGSKGKLFRPYRAGRVLFADLGRRFTASP